MMYLLRSHPSWRLCVILAALLKMTAVQAQLPAPVEVLKEMSDRVVAIVKQDPGILDDQSRLRIIADTLIVPHVDFQVFSQWVLGKHWRTATPEQRRIFVREFKELLINTYLSSVTSKGYQDQQIRYQPLRSGLEDGKVLVDAVVEQKQGPLIHVQFRMYRNGNDWLVYDVVVEGVSLVATHRSSFSSIIREKGMSGLIAMLEERNAERINNQISEAPAAGIK
ncbi:MAG: ABC transporter substrate-binding protein [Gammaproteobacteria bacterium]